MRVMLWQPSDQLWKRVGQIGIKPTRLLARLAFGKGTSNKPPLHRAMSHSYLLGNGRLTRTLRDKLCNIPESPCISPLPQQIFPKEMLLDGGAIEQHAG
jgi:hypothetical protein